MTGQVTSADRKLIRDINQNRILNLIRLHAPISRPQLAARSGLSGVTVLDITNDLIARNIVTESGFADSTGGRKATLLEIRPDSGYAIGLMLREYEVVGVVLNLQASIICVQHWDVTLLNRSSEAVESLAQKIEELILQAAIPRKHIIGIGCAISGYVDADNGVCVDSWQLGWHHFELGGPLARRLQIPVYVDNNVSCVTCYEKLFGQGRPYQHFLTVAIGRGLGLGIVINGDIYRGATGGAGEFGHIMVVPEGRRCECGKTGCLEAYVAFQGILTTYAELSQKANQQARSDNVTDVVGSIAQLYQKAKGGEHRAQEALRKAGTVLGIQLANVVNLFNPECIVLTGEGTMFGDYLFAPMEEALRAHTFSQLGTDLQIILESWTSYEIWSRGAAALVLRRFFAISSQT